MRTEWAMLRHSVATMKATSEACGADGQAFAFGLVLDEMTTIELAYPGAFLEPDAIVPAPESYIRYAASWASPAGRAQAACPCCQRVRELTAEHRLPSGAIICAECDQAGCAGS